ncbi:MAG: CRISPR-associated endonuclease Cas2 [Candidatus Competibacteraceae bacterium]|nr:CRISPR-associated endonuclease Cas2 [Candidatus Competibacteraceae bacterium]
MPDRALYLAAYDVTNADRLQAALRVLKGYASGGQKSVFECFLTARERTAMLVETGRRPTAGGNPAGAGRARLPAWRHPRCGRKFGCWTPLLNVGQTRPPSRTTPWHLDAAGAGDQPRAGRLALRGVARLRRGRRARGVPARGRRGAGVCVRRPAAGA